MEPLVKENPRVLAFQISLGETLMWLANLNTKQKDYAAALTNSGRAIALLEAVQKQDPRETVRVALHSAHLVRSQAYQERGWQAAADFLRMFANPPRTPNPKAGGN